ncbi:putative alpha/beta fold family hydrolase [Hyaloscypha variabilis F]|uniref:Putative alpha/beta fold family hydrolase n=1 Tax=Hyaloscypha variabilis (strain UAMH 11265 / GT02V1 / F) TaxID=1149755 RepID=A0A2J6RTH1_HYAVF|nr:putative alpha/beta fold family hydrolase [Hyaloscypha variabilis F]
MPHTVVNIPSVTGKKINAWLYEPSSLGPHAVLVMGGGIGLVKAGGLPPFAEAFQAEGYAALTIDYLSFGDSEGLPRNVLSLSQELQDFRDVIAWVRNNPSFDNEKIVAWGSSLGAMSPTALIVEDHALAAAIVQCPAVDGLLSALQVPLWRSLPLTFLALLDTIVSWVGLGPIYITTANTGNAKLAMLSAHDVPDGWARLMPEDGTPFLNQFAARGLFSILVHRPSQRTGRSIKPYLAICTEHDTVASLKGALNAAKNAPLGEIVTVKGGHFDVYKGGISFEEGLKAQIEFLKRVVPLSRA